MKLHLNVTNLVRCQDVIYDGCTTISPCQQAKFRASSLYHLPAISQNSILSKKILDIQGTHSYPTKRRNSNFMDYGERLTSKKLFDDLNEKFCKFDKFVGEVKDVLETETTEVLKALKERDKEMVSCSGINERFDDETKISTDSIGSEKSSEIFSLDNNEKFVNPVEISNNLLIEPLHLELLTPHPDVPHLHIRYSEMNLDKQNTKNAQVETDLPTWLTLLPNKHGKFLLSLTSKAR